ncbi:MAG: hypothetical protein RH860_05900 [Cytophagales bacterium]
MKKSVITIKALIILALMIMGCQDDDTNIIDDNLPQEEERVGFELIEIISMDSILVWINDEQLSQEEFDSIELPANWRKNEPREGDADGGSFSRSPDATEDGVFSKKEHFGYQWLFNAKIIDTNVPLPNNEEGLLRGSNIAKYHQVKFNAGKTLYVLISPDGDEYVRISRDANRTTDIPIIPDTWLIEERIINEDLTIDLPIPTLNIRAENNQDSFQGPVEL